MSLAKNPRVGVKEFFSSELFVRFVKIIRGLKIFLKKCYFLDKNDKNFPLNAIFALNTSLPPLHPPYTLNLCIIKGDINWA
jgi:hypothetical protein